MSTETAPPPRRFRRDIEGLRALAVVFVLIHHASASLLPGGFIGVDMFFVVSGFVITTQLVSEVERTGTVNLPGFYARRAKRLLPAAAMVLVFTAIVSWLFASRIQWSLIGTDIAASALYVVNWVFAARSVDYLAEDVEPSPVQHFWSLAVEEQFYVIWPLLIIGLALVSRWLVRRSEAAGEFRLPLRGTLAIGLLALVVVPSLTWGIYYTMASPERAYFVTTTRLWELGIGALVAVLAPTWDRLSQRVGAIVAWLGLLLLFVGLALITLETPWPGAAALAPTLATALIIVGGFKAEEQGPVRVLGLSPLVWIGGLSYSLYLWHWPILSAGVWIWGDAGLLQGLVLAAASVVPAWAGYHLVEKRFRYSKAMSDSPRYALSIGANFTLLGAVAGLVLSAAAVGAQQQEVTQVAEADFGLGTGPDDTPLFPVITPDPGQATADVPDVYARGCQVAVEDTEVVPCLSESATTGDISVAVVGDSKIAQWLPALDAIAVEQGWQLTSYTKSGCAFSSATQTVGDDTYPECVTWNEELEGLLVGAEPDFIVTSGVVSQAVDGDGKSQEAMSAGYVEKWNTMGELGIPVVVISDTPQPEPGVTPYECVAENMDNPNEACSWPSDGGSGSDTLLAAVDQVPTATYLDMNQFVCQQDVCSPVYRNVLTYRQGSHITVTFVELLRETLADQLVPAVEASLS